MQREASTAVVGTSLVLNTGKKRDFPGRDALARLLGGKVISHSTLHDYVRAGNTGFFSPREVYVKGMQLPSRGPLESWKFLIPSELMDTVRSQKGFKNEGCALLADTDGFHSGKDGKIALQSQNIALIPSPLKSVALRGKFHEGTRMPVETSPEELRALPPEEVGTLASLGGPGFWIIARFRHGPADCNSNGWRHVAADLPIDYHAVLLVEYTGLKNPLEAKSAIDRVLARENPLPDGPGAAAAENIIIGIIRESRQ